MARARSADYQLNREAILRAATKLFARQGYPGTSMSDLARECGVSKALLYHYVSDKYELLREIAEGHVARLAVQVAQTEPLRLAPQAKLRELIRRFMREYAQARDDHAVLTQDVKFLQPADRDRVLGIERQVVAAFAATIAAARPELHEADLDKPLTMLLFGMINWMFTWLKPDGRLDYDDMAPLVADLFVGGLAAVRPPARATIPTP